MADVKISALPASTTPLAGTEVLPIVQSSTTKQVSVANLTAGRAVNALSLTTTNGAVIQGLTVGKGANAVAGNTAVGVSALSGASLSGDYNSSIGFGSLTANSSGNFNNAVGAGTLSSNTTGSSNAVLGHSAGSALTTGSNNTIIGSVAGTAGLSDTVIIAAGSAERMRIDSSGNVGIGTTTANPAGFGRGVNLDGTSNVGYQVSVGGTFVGYFGAYTGETRIGSASTYPMTFYTNGTERMRIDSSGVISYTGSLTVSAYTETIVASGTVGASATLAITAGTVLTATLTSATACTFTMPTATAGKSFILLLKQPASGTATTAIFTGVKFNSSGAPTITATVGKMDILTFVADGTNWYGSYSQGYTP